MAIKTQYADMIIIIIRHTYIFRLSTTSLTMVDTSLRVSKGNNYLYILQARILEEEAKKYLAKFP